MGFDPFEPGFVESPYAHYARLWATDPVHWFPLLEGWVLTRYDDVARVLREPSFSVDRADASHHLQFGIGVHSCLGAHFARLQAKVALHALTTRLDHIDLDGPPVFSERVVIRGLQHLPISFDARS